MVWYRRLNYYKHLLSTGFYKVGTSYNKGYNTFLIARTHKTNLYLLSTLVESIYRILPVVLEVYSKRHRFLFVDLKKTNLFFLNYLYKILHSSVAFIIYDWAYGIITNSWKIRLDEYTYATNFLPSIVFLLFLYNQQSMICNELRIKRLLQISLVDTGSLNHIDYPIFLANSGEYANFFLLFLLRIFKTSHIA